MSEAVGILYAMPSLTMLTVHAHPDDESSKGAGTVARYHAEGVHTVLVTCTGGEEGDILNPAMDLPGIKDRIAEVRADELAKAAEVIGYDEVVMLGYRDSGMPDSPANADPRSFAQAPLDEAVERLVRVVRRSRPQVIVAYPKDQSGYPHPDHLRANEIAEIAFDAAADPERYPDVGEPWQPLKLYYVTWSARRTRAMHEKFLELGMESPFSEERMARLMKVEREGVAPDAVIDINGYASTFREALLAHATQVDPTSPHWFGLPPEVADQIHPFDEYQLARNLTASEPPEDDLFAGIRTPVSR
jgi:mycothiol S-conjugate amidase